MDSNRCPHCGRRGPFNPTSPEAFLLDYVRKYEPVPLKHLVNDGVDSGIDKSSLMNAIYTAESRGEITIDKDWTIHAVEKRAVEK